MKELVANSLSKAAKLPKEEILNLIEIPPSSHLGDYSFPCFALSKKFRKNPQEIARDLIKKISKDKFEKIEAKGPYINFFLNKEKLVQKTINKILKEKEEYGSKKIKELVLIESPGPNTNKPLHVGHARNIILAQAAQNILTSIGNRVKIVNINNDRGVHICKSMVSYEKFGKGLTPQKAKKKSDHFIGDFYVRYAQEVEKNKNLENEVKTCLTNWEKGDKKTLELWKKMNSWAFKGFNETYKKFNLKIDKEYYESETYEKGKDIVLEQYKKAKVKKKPDGAYFVDLSKENLGEKILVRADGTSIYITQDFYLAIKRKKDFDFGRMIYIVGNEQNYHFKVLFTLLKKFGFKWAEKLHHLNYGLVHLESGRLKSREGRVVDSDDLITELKNLALNEIEARYKKLPKKEKLLRSEKIAMASLRYYFLKVDKERDMVFKPKESISFEGNTGPYLLYTYARAKSILRKSNLKKQANIKVDVLTKTEKQLVSQLSLFPEIVEKASNNLAPNLIANYAYQISQKFNEFYHKEKVIGSDNEAFKISLVLSFSIVLKKSLNLLNIETLERM